MKNFVVCSLFLLCASSASAALWLIEARAAYFWPSSPLMREIYHHGGMEPEVEGGARLYKELWAWANFSAFYRKGTSTGLHTPTSIQIYPLSAGLKYVFEIKDFFSFYAGLGPSYTWTITCNHSPYVRQRVSKSAWGVVGKSGFLFFLPHHLLLDLFVDYSYCRLSALSQAGVQSSSINVGGLKTGIGIGVAF